MKRLVMAVVVVLLLGGGAFAESPRVMPVPWVAVDGLGRRIDSLREAQPGKFVGVLYYIWHGAHGYDTLFNPSAASGEGVMPWRPRSSAMGSLSWAVLSPPAVAWAKRTIRRSRRATHRK